MTAQDQQKVVAAIETLCSHGWHWGDASQGQDQRALYLHWQGASLLPEQVASDQD